MPKKARSAGPASAAWVCSIIAPQALSLGEHFVKVDDELCQLPEPWPPSSMSVKLSAASLANALTS
jgi:hypothetical protein